MKNLRPFLLIAVVISAAACASKYIRDVSDEVVEITPERVARGEYLVKAVGACGGCHDSRKDGNLLNPPLPGHELAGGNYLEDMGLRVWVPNITNDVETGLGAWSDDEIMRAIRDGVRPDGRFLFPMMAYNAYQHLSDEDTRSIVAYLRSTPAVKRPGEEGKSEIPFMLRFLVNRGVAAHPPARDVPEPNRADRVAYGEYVARAAHCTECHSLGKRGTRGEGDRYMAGSDVAMDIPGVGEVWAPNLTPDPETGIGGRSKEEIVRVLRTGMRLDGKLIAPPMSVLMPHYALMEEDDVDALATWLLSLPPVKQATPPRVLSAEWKEILRD